MKVLDTVFGWLAKAVAFIFLILLPVRAAMCAVMALVFMDLISGVWASKKQKRAITSSGLRRTIVKLFGYEFVIIFAFVMEQYLMQGIPVVKAVAGLIAITEGKSFFENMYRITGIDFWEAILDKLHGGNFKISSSDEENKP